MTVDLSTLKNKSDDPKTLKDLTDEQKAQIEALAEKTAAEDAGYKCRTAFLVVVDEDGSAQPVVDLDFKVDRKWVPTSNDILSATAFLNSRVQIESTAAMTVGGMQQMAQMQMQAMQNAQIAAGLQLPK